MAHREIGSATPKEISRVVILRRLAEGLCDGNRSDAFVALVGAIIMTAERSDMADELYAIAERSIAVARAAAKSPPGSAAVSCVEPPFN